MTERLACSNCQLKFDNLNNLSNHKQKFCIQSKYGDIQSLDQLYSQFNKDHKQKDISMYGRMALAQKGLKYDIGESKIVNRQGHDEQYKTILKQINENQNLRTKMQRQKEEALRQLSHLDKKQNQLLIEARREDLQQILKKRNDLQKEQQRLEKEINSFHNQGFDTPSQSKVAKVQDDFVYKEGRQAGKLAMQRKMLEQKKKDIERQLKMKKRIEEKIEEDLNSSKFREQIYIPDFQKVEPMKRQVRIDKNSQFQSLNMSQISQAPKSNFNENKYHMPKIKENQKSNKFYNHDQIADKSIIKNHSQSLLMSQADNQEFLKPQYFMKNQKTLFESVNPKGKSDEDIFIETLLAQEYDSLNMLAKLPKNSELYQTKLKQYTEMSKIREDLKQKIQRKRVDKVKKQFEYQKQMGQTQKANLLWLDQNRRKMLNKQMQTLKKNEEERQLEQMNERIKENERRMKKGNQMFKGTEGIHKSNIGGIRQTNNYKSPSQESLQSNNYQPTLIQRSNNPLARMSGFKITLRSLRNYKNKGPIKFKFILKEQHSSGEEIFTEQWSSAYHDDFAPKDSRNPYNPNTRNRMENGAIFFDDVFVVEQNLQALYNQNQKEIYLFIMALQKDIDKMSNEPQLHGWYCFKITHFGQIRQGVYTVNLYSDHINYPHASDMNKLKSKMEDEVSFQIGQHLIEMKSPIKQVRQTNRKPLQSTQRKKLVETHTKDNRISLEDIMDEDQQSVQRQKRHKKQQVTRKVILQSYKKAKNNLKNVDEPFYHENQEGQDFFQHSSSDPVNFNFSIGYACTLPSYCGPLKFQISFIDSNGYQIMEPDYTLSEMGKDMYNPTVNYTRKVRNEEFSSRSGILIRIMTMSTINYEVYMLGFSFIDLFYDHQGVPISSASVTDSMMMINGLYQIPVYWGNPSIKYFSASDLTNYPQIPCTSLLIGIQSSMEQDPDHLPAYSSKNYSTMLFNIDQNQFRLFKQQYKRQKLGVAQYVKGFYKFKGIKEKSQNELTKFLSKSLDFNKQNVSNLFDLKHLAQYNAKFGITLNLDSIHIPPTEKTYYYFMTSCLSPTANYYLKDGNDIEICYKIDLGISKAQEVFFSQEHALTYNIPYDENSCVIVELCRASVEENNVIIGDIEVVAHSVIQLFDSQSPIKCAKITSESQNLFEDQFQKAQLRLMQTDLPRYLQENKGKKRSKYSLSYRVINGFYPDQFRRGQSKAHSGKPLKNIFQSSRGFNNVVKKMEKLIMEYYPVKL